MDESIADATWTLRLLGCAELRDGGGEPVRLRTRHALILLAMLASLQGEETSRSDLAETVWPDSSPKAARESLRTALSALRKALPPNTIRASVEHVRMDASFLACDWLSPVDHRTYTGDFMPGFHHDWVIDKRLRLRYAASDHALREARAEIRPEEALKLVDRACEIDPWNQDAAAAKVELLEKLGNRDRAFAVADAYRVKMLRNLGMIAEVRPEPEAEVEHPLYASARWLLDRNPDEVVELMAATSAQWLLMPVDSSLEFHERALDAAEEDSEARRLVSAQLKTLRIVAGRLTSDLSEYERPIDEAIGSGEYFAAARLAGALAYYYLSKGFFEASIEQAKRSLTAAKATKKPHVEVEFEQLHSIILTHAGKRELGLKMQREAAGRIEEEGTPLLIAGHGLLLMDSLIAEGKLEKAADVLERSRRIFESCSSGRMTQWVMLARAVLHQALGENVEAKALLERVRAIGPKVGGHAVTAMTDDWLAAIDCRLGEFDTAAEALARSSLYRRGVGAVPSVSEREHIQSTRRVLKNRLDRRDLRAAFLRVQQGL